MKKGLLCLLGATILVVPTFAQDAEKDRVDDSLFMAAGFDSAYSVYLDASNRCAGIKDLTGAETEALWTAATWGPCTYDVSFTDGVMSIAKTLKSSDANWASIDLQLGDWKGGSGEKFVHLAEKAGKNVDTLTGMFVDMSIDDQIVMNFTVRTDADCQLRVDLVDANGRQGNGKAPSDYQNSQKIDLKSEDAWVEVELTWSAPLFDYYSENFWGATTGINNAHDPLWIWKDKENELTDTLRIKKESGIPVSMQTISKIMLIIDDGGITDPGVAGDVKTVEIKDMSLGKYEGAVPFKAVTDQNITDGYIEYQPSNAVLARARQDLDFGPSIYYTPSTPVEEVATSVAVYPNPATDVINVEGFATVSTLAGVVVAEGEGTIDVSALATGTYVVKTANGSAIVTVK